MAYLYAGLGVALLIPLMAMVQTLVGLTSLESEVASSRDTQLKLIASSLNTFGYGLYLAMNERNPKYSQFTGQLSNNKNSANSNKKSCGSLPMAGLPRPDGASSVTWYGAYPDCAAVFAVEGLDPGSTRYLRVEMLVDVDEETNFPKGSEGHVPNTTYSTPDGDELYNVPQDALRVISSCWTPFGFNYAIDQCP